MSTATKTLWKIDPTHSEVQFKIKHLVISTVTGNFNSFEGHIETHGTDFEEGSARFKADIDSISTNNDDRDEHLKGEDFFDAENHPQLTFESIALDKTDDAEYKLIGELTIRETTKEVELKAIHGGTVEDHLGNTKAGFEVTGTINRKEFGLNFHSVTEAGNVVVGDEVKLLLNIQLTQQ